MKSISTLPLWLSIFIVAPLFAQTRPATQPSTVPLRSLGIAQVLGLDPKPPLRPKNLPAGATMELDLHYGDAPGRGQLLDLYLPEKITAPLPLLIWIHGGGWSGGDKAGCPALAMIPRGYAVASLNYRLSQEARFPAQIQDCKGAIRWLRAHAQQYHLDPQHIGVWGASAGGHLVALLGTSGGEKEIEGNVGGNLDQSSAVQCVIDWFGPSDMSVFFDQAATAPNIFKADPDRSPIATLFGGPVRDHLDLVRLANPITFVKKGNPPFLIVHGDKDTLVPVAQSEMLADALKKAGDEVSLEVLEGAGHGNGFDKPALRDLMADFVDKHLK